ncbi:MAG TPA: hypothetical protein VL200_01740 [Lacunisphaera sp.]|jgi:sugar lactone lactonase YvrE|nr:hypothetical protein [Lacunisphaera sp.]
MNAPRLLRVAACLAAAGLLAAASAAETQFRSLPVGATPESVVPGFGGKLYVTLMGVKRVKGDGDGKIVVIDDGKVSDFATGLDDPKGLVFVGGMLVTTDFDKVWAIDGHGAKRVLAAPEAFPEAPRFLNDVVVEPGGRSVLVTDMGDLGAMFDPKGAFWPLDSDEARRLVPHGRVYRLTLEGKVTIAVDHSPEMPDPNGVDELPDGTILAAEFFRGTLLAWKDGKFRVVAGGFRSADGLVHDDAGHYFITEVRTGRVWRVDAATGEKQLLAKLESAADLLYDGPGHQLIVPDSKAGRLVYLPLAP